ncbi:MAG: enoyl-CoA hydratase/isomerase family protein [Rhodospirillales bacterium]
MTDSILLTVTSGVARLTLNRPEIRNAFDDALIAVLNRTLDELAARDDVRLLVLTGAGKAFSAGADLNWMRRMADYSHDENHADAMELAKLLRRLNEFPRPVIALVNGPAYAGAVGLVSCCDIVLASAEASFAISEAKLGLIPATISPYVVAALGERNARRYVLSADVFDAAEARRIGLVHEVVAHDNLAEAGETLISRMLKNSPNAMTACKPLIRNVVSRPVDDTLMDYTARGIADIRASAEGREGVAAFLEKRRPAWVQEQE